MRHTLSVVVVNSPGVLTRVSGLFARRGYNIESLTVSATQRSDISRMTIVVEGDPAVLEQMVKQLNKLIDVIKVWDITDTALSRELALIKVSCRAATRSQLLEGIWDVAGDFVNDNTLTVYIKRLREKLEDNPQAPQIIKTVRGVGYKLERGEKA